MIKYKHNERSVIMIKKLSVGIICVLIAVLCVGCSCAQKVPPKTYEVKQETPISEYAAFVTADTWVNVDSGDTFLFGNGGTYEGTINGKKYSGEFSLTSDEKKAGVVYANVIPDGEDEEVTYTLKFKDSSTMILTTDTGEKEKFVAKWTTEK